MKTVRLTMAQALVRYLIAQKTEIDGDACRSSPASSPSSVTATSPASPRRWRR